MIENRDSSPQRRSWHPARLRSHFSELRFWIIQLLAVGVTAVHGVVEYSETHGGPSVVIDTLHYLPVEAYILPVVLAAWWYGLEGGLFTGLLATVLSIPNLWLFHSTGLAWVGELAAISFVVAVGVLVAFMVERADTAREEAEATSRRLETLHAVTRSLSRTDELRSMVVAVLDGLSRVHGVRAAAFVPSNGFLPGGPVIIGELDADVLSQGGEEADVRPRRDVPLTEAEVTTSETTIGRLVIDCGWERPCDDDAAMLDHVARELSIAMENAQMRAKERAHLQRYARAVTSAQESERKRLARDLHDGAAQSLIVLSRGLGQLAEESAAERAHMADELRQVARQALQSIRRTTWALRPALLDDLGLVSAIESLAEHQSARLGITIEVEAQGQPRRLDHDVEVAAFRITQEALSNIERHASAGSAAVEIAFLDHSLQVRVIDDGKGFDPSAVDDGRRFGVTGMRERAEAVGGHLSIDSHHGEGTTVTFAKEG